MFYEHFGFRVVPVMAGYNENGVDLFIRFTKLYIPLETLYQMHATSDFEGLTRLVGENLPGNLHPLVKGMLLFAGIDQSNRALIQQSGILTRLSN